MLKNNRVNLQGGGGRGGNVLYLFSRFTRVKFRAF